MPQAKGQQAAWRQHFDQRLAERRLKRLAKRKDHQATNLLLEDDMAKINWMSVKETAAALDLSAWRVRYLCREGRLPAKRKRHGWIIPRKLVRLSQMAEGNAWGGMPNAAMTEYEEHMK